jgi:hypothetical protein
VKRPVLVVLIGPGEPELGGGGLGWHRLHHIPVPSHSRWSRILRFGPLRLVTYLIYASERVWNEEAHTRLDPGLSYGGLTCTPGMVGGEGAGWGHGLMSWTGAAGRFPIVLRACYSESGCNYKHIDTGQDALLTPGTT